MWHLFAARDIFAFAGAGSIFGLLRCTVAPTTPGSRGLLSVLSWLSFPGDPVTSHVWPLIRTACVCMHGLLACLFVCMLACFCQGDFHENSRDRTNGTAVKCVFRRFCPSSECPCIWFVPEQVAWRIQNVYLLFGIILLRDTGDSPLPNGSPPTS